MNATSKLTAQGQVSVPASVRRKLGIGPGATLAWEADGDRVIVRRIGAHTSEAVHAALFADKPTHKTLTELRAGITAHLRKRHARD
ncbi:MAG: AbrB/MazE/SpoVT family DNA-binding domain-containing protein [Dokdonella sp.]